MVQNYTNIHLPQYPCVLENWLHDVVRRMLLEKKGDTDLVLLEGISKLFLHLWPSTAGKFHTTYVSLRH